MNMSLELTTVNIERGEWPGAQNESDGPLLDDSFIDGQRNANVTDSHLSHLENLDLANYVVVPTIFVVGLFGNIMTFVLMQRGFFRTTSVALILSALSVSDTAVILMVPWNKTFFQRLIGFDARGLHWFGCKLFFWMWRSAKITSAWLIVLISLERFIAIIYPLKARTMINKRRVAYVLLLVYSVVFVYNGIRFAFSDVVRNGKCLAAVPDDPADEGLTQAFVTVATSFSTYIPSTLVFLLNAVSVYKLLSQSLTRTEMAVRSVQLDRQQRVCRHLSSMLLGVSFAFQLLVTPISVLHVLAAMRGIALFHTTEFGIVVAREIAMMMEQTNYSINFYMYVLCSRDFRRQFVGLFTNSRNVRLRKNANFSSFTESTNASNTSVTRI